MIRKRSGWSGKRGVMKFTYSVTDMECKCFCESESELLEYGDIGGLGQSTSDSRTGMIV